MRRRKVIIDTNLWISFLISKDCSFLDNYIENGRIKLVFSEELLKEFLSVVQRPILKKYFDNKDIEYVIRIIDNFGILQKVSTKINQCRDIKDNFLLALAIDSNADFLVTGDNDLLIIKNIGKTKILKIKEFFEVI